MPDAAALERLVDTQLRHRGRRATAPPSSPRIGAGDDLARVADADAEVDALSLPRDLREASRRAGRGLLRVHARLGTRNAAGYLERVAAGAGAGHAPVVQGLVWRGAGVDEDGAVLLSAHVARVSLVSAGVRLGVITHIDAQAILERAGSTVARLVREPLPRAPAQLHPRRGHRNDATRDPTRPPLRELTSPGGTADQVQQEIST